MTRKRCTSMSRASPSAMTPRSAPVPCRPTRRGVRRPRPDAGRCAGRSVPGHARLRQRRVGGISVRVAPAIPHFVGSAVSGTPCAATPPTTYGPREIPAATVTRDGVVPARPWTSTPRNRRRASMPRSCGAPMPATPRRTPPRSARSDRVAVTAAVHAAALRRAAWPAVGDRCVPGFRPVGRTSKPATVVPLSGLRGRRRGTFDTAVPLDPKLHRRLG